MENNRHLPLILASSSPYRADLLRKLGLKFSQVSPNIDESQLPNEEPEHLASRLSENKALALCKQFKKHIIIASDQVAINHKGELLGKPLTEANAIRQLQECANNMVRFYTGLCVLCPNNQEQISNKADNECLDTINIDGKAWYKQTTIDTYEVYFKALNKHQIINYVSKDQPLNCAGSFKSEGLGISLFRSMKGNDPNSLIGLPLIKLCELLLNLGIDVLDV